MMTIRSLLLTSLFFAGGIAPAFAGSTDPATATDTVGWTLERTDELRWGVYEILWSREAFTRRLDHTRATLGEDPSFVLFFRDLGRSYPTSICEEITRRGATPVVSIELIHWGGPSTGRLEAITRGEYDALFAGWARDARDSGHRVLYRFGFEMNGDWFPWGTQPALFIEAWRRVHGIFREEGAHEVLWLWSPNAISGPNTPENGLEKYWPGDAFVDVIGLDGYNFGDDYSPWHQWTDFAGVFGPALDRIRESGVPHPVLISEFGCTHTSAPERRADWIRDAYRYLRSRPEVVGAIWFNYDKRREGEPNWRVDADPESLQAWRETFGRRESSDSAPRISGE